LKMSMASRQREGGAGAVEYAVEVLSPKGAKELPGISAV
jgi:hypothetical protein